MDSKVGCDETALIALSKLSPGKICQILQAEPKGKEVLLRSLLNIAYNLRITKNITCCNRKLSCVKEYTAAVDELVSSSVSVKCKLAILCANPGLVCHLATLCPKNG